MNQRHMTQDRQLQGSSKTLNPPRCTVTFSDFKPSYPSLKPYPAPSSFGPLVVILSSPSLMDAPLFEWSCLFSHELGSILTNHANVWYIFSRFSSCVSGPVLVFLCRFSVVV